MTEGLISRVVKIHEKLPGSTDTSTWYPQPCKFLKLKHHVHPPYEKSLIERTMQYIKDRTESIDY